ncbi:hypothetical protein [Blastococcus sp. SYSU DS0619]
MSSVMENRAAVFTSQPQAVEVYQAGAWWAGELLGWRHDDSGACQVWVRVAVGGVEETAWTELSTLRLPEPPASPEVAVVAAPRVTQDMAAAQAVSALRSARPGGAETTASLPLVRDHVGQSAPAVGPGGRRRAPEDAGVQVAAAASVPVPPSGRHRAPAPDAVAGRHRAADTAFLATVAGDVAAAAAEVPAASRDDHPDTAAWSVPAARGALPVETNPGGRGWPPPAGLEADLLTRPMRLSDQVPQSRRRPRVHGGLGGA